MFNVHHSHLVHDGVGEVVGEHVEHEAVGAGELQVVEAPGAHLPHQDRPGDHQDEDDEKDSIGKRILLDYFASLLQSN